MKPIWIVDDDQSIRFVLEKALLRENLPTRSFTTSNNGAIYAPDNSAPTNMAFQTLTVFGGSLPHNNLQPYLTLLFCIALQGVFPARP